MRNTVLNLWLDGRTADDIADETGLHRDTVFAHLRSARLQGDPRAARRPYQAPARKRSLKIKLLAAVGANKHYIANMLGVNERTVRNVLREAR